MKKFIILTDSCSDLPKDLRIKFEIEYLTMRIIYDGNDLPASLDWEYIPVKDFYNLMRDGKRFTTAQITSFEYKNAFENYVKQGYDVLSISCSSALSGSYKASLIARDEVLSENPQAKIICVDSLNACMGLGLLCITASEIRAEGKSIEEVAEYIENNKLRMHQFAAVDDLTYLKRAGRVSASSAFFGGILKIKPIIISDVNGQNVAMEKVKGRIASVNRIAELFKQHYQEDKYQKIAVLHADCNEDGELLKEKICQIMPDKNVEIISGYIGPIIGATVGPGTIVVYFFGDQVTFKA